MSKKISKKNSKKRKDELTNTSPSFLAKHKRHILHIALLSVTFLLIYNYIFDDKVTTLGANAS